MSHTSEPCRAARNIRYCSSIVLPDPGVPAHSTDGGRAERQASVRSNSTGSSAALRVFAITGPALVPTCVVAVGTIAPNSSGSSMLS